MTLLSWDLIAPVGYEAGQELSFNLHLEAPEGIGAKDYYVLGGLYDVNIYVAGSIFGVLIPAGADYGVNSPTYMSTWRLESGQADCSNPDAIERTRDPVGANHGYYYSTYHCGGSNRYDADYDKRNV